MDLQEIIMKLLESLPWAAGIGATIMTVLEFSKIKINPWSWLAKNVGRAVNGELMKKMDEVEKQAIKVEEEVVKLREDVEEKDAIACRTRILRFGDEAVHKMKHSREHFEQILRDITSYEEYCSDHPKFRNNQAVLTCKRIKEIYAELLITGEFL